MTLACWWLAGDATATAGTASTEPAMAAIRTTPFASLPFIMK
jgi:hypothetical protein